VPNAFSKEEIVAFDKLLPAFEDQLAMSMLVQNESTDQTQMARTGDVLWFPEPYIATSNSGSDATTKFAEVTQLSVPLVIDQQKFVALQMTDRELRDELQAERFGQSAIQKLASDINVACLDVASQQGTIYVKRSGAATGFDDVAAVDVVLSAQGIRKADRRLVLSSQDYHGMASDLQKNTRSLDNSISTQALRDAFVGRVSGIDTFELDYSSNQAAAAGGGGITMSTLATGVNIYVPVATSVGSGGQEQNVDNRRQLITVSSTTNVAAGDAFTIANVFAVHHITKRSTGVPKTFRVMKVVSSTTMEISPPIISNSNVTTASAMYQNCTITSAASNAALVFLNTVAAPINPFFTKGSILLAPGKLETPSDAGVAVMSFTTKQGVMVRLMKAVDINTGKLRMRWDVFFGVTMLQPEMAGLIEFSQT
jgi:hypothetical protein